MSGSNKYKITLTYSQMCNVYNLLDNKIRDLQTKKGDLYWIDVKIYKQLKEKFKHENARRTDQ